MVRTAWRYSFGKLVGGDLAGRDETLRQTVLGLHAGDGEWHWLHLAAKNSDARAGAEGLLEH